MQNASELDKYLRSVGDLVVSWAHLELGIDASIRIIHAKVGGEKIEAKEPRHLDQKLKYLERCIAEIVALEPYRLEIQTLVTKVRESSETRHDIVHGAMTKVPLYKQAGKALRIMRGSKIPIAKDIALSTDKVSAAAENAKLLTADSLNIVDNLIREFVLEDEYLPPSE